MDASNTHRKPPPTLSRQLSLIHSSNLLELHKSQTQQAPEENAATPTHTMTLATALAAESHKPSPSTSASSTRTLLDIIRDDNLRHQQTQPTDLPSNSTQPVNWKTFKDRLVLRRASAAFSSSSIYPSQTPTLFSPPTVPAPSTTSDAPTRVSLMALLEQTDRMGGNSASEESTAAVKQEEQEEEEEEEMEEKEGEMIHVCCVCMVRHKGAAFIPCGHTFCRLCSRELWVSRGNCPLCNGFILEILDIF